MAPLVMIGCRSWPLTVVERLGNSAHIFLRHNRNSFIPPLLLPPNLPFSTLCHLRTHLRLYRGRLVAELLHGHHLQLHSRARFLGSIHWSQMYERTYDLIQCDGHGAAYEYCHACFADPLAMAALSSEVEKVCPFRYLHAWELVSILMDSGWWWRWYVANWGPSH